MIQDGIRRTGSLLLNRLLSGIWVPMLGATLLAALSAAGLGMLDRAFLSAELAGLPGPFGYGAGAAENHLDALLAVQVAVLTLYVSITLLVLTLAASSLGSRLIERWIARIEIRATLVQWVALVVFTLVARLFVVEGEPVPRGTLTVDGALTLVALAWLGYGYHRLARTAHVDTSIHELGRTFARDRQDWGLAAGPDDLGAPNRVLRAWRSGYLGGFDRDRLIDVAAEVGGRIRFAVPDGRFVVDGDPLAELWGDDGRMEAALRDTCEIADYRTDRPTGPFSLALLVEVGARALSPSVNDHETAGSCADWIGHGLAKRLGREDGPEGWFVDDGGTPRLMVPESGVILQSRPYLSVFERAARPHPFVAARLIDAYGAALRRATDPRDRQRLSEMIADVSSHVPGDATEAERRLVAAAMGRAGDRAEPPAPALAAE